MALHLDNRSCFHTFRQFLLIGMLRSFTFILIINIFGFKSSILSFVFLLFCFLFFHSFFYLLLSYLNIFLVFHFNLSYVLTSLNFFSVFTRLILCICKLSIYFIPVSGMKKSYHSMFPSTLPPNVVGILYITIAYIEILIRWYILFPFNLKAYFKDINRKRMVYYIYLS